MLNVISCQRTCLACPSQWEGLCSNGQYIYIRFRWGTLRFGLGATIDDAVKDSFNFVEKSFDRSCFDGSMTNAEMQHAMLEYDIHFAEITGGDL